MDWVYMQKKFDLNLNGDFKTFDSFMKEVLNIKETLTSSKHQVI